METSKILVHLRESYHLTQAEMAAQLHVTRQAVSRWECGDTTPNPDTLKQLSRIFGVSINTLLGSPQKLVCQSCGMPLDSDELLAHESDGALNESFCKWCYNDGHFCRECTMDEMIEQCLPHMVNPSLGITEPVARKWMQDLLPTLGRWKSND